MEVKSILLILIALIISYDNNHNGNGNKKIETFEDEKVNDRIRYFLEILCEKVSTK